MWLAHAPWRYFPLIMNGTKQPPQLEHPCTSSAEQYQLTITCTNYTENKAVMCDYVMYSLFHLSILHVTDCFYMLQVVFPDDSWCHYWLSWCLGVWLCRHSFIVSFIHSLFSLHLTWYLVPFELYVFVRVCVFSVLLMCCGLPTPERSLPPVLSVTLWTTYTVLHIILACNAIVYSYSLSDVILRETKNCKIF